jgi:hypothetical protein
MKNEVTVAVCPECGQINVELPGSTGCICPVCDTGVDMSDEITIELIG